MATKKTTKKKAAKKATAKRARVAPARVSIRMYRHGLGDCFLLKFARGKETPFFMLIDCGVILGTPEPKERLLPVLADIAKVTDSRIDLLVVTHEHWDHVSGFAQVKEEFDNLKFKQVWLAWTEDGRDQLANKLRKERRDAENALRMAVTHLGLAGDESTAARVDSLVAFFGAAGGSTPEAMKYAADRAPGGKPRYCQPGEPPIELADLPGIRFWVMGPPKNEKLIKKSNPSHNDAYGLDALPGGSQALLLSGLMRAMGATAELTSTADERIEDPFDPAYCIPMVRAQHIPFFEKTYFGDSGDASLYDRTARAPLRDQSWRRIDSDWMGGAETMALQLDSATNNTSLVLAIELTDTGEVLLFPGDAQAGNWLSWQDLRWTVEDDGEESMVTGPELLARTVFYKVGHHGSHNATLKDKGLELMVSDKLMAMIPVDHTMAKKKGWGRIPLKELVSRLREKTNGRVLMADDAVTTPADLAQLKPTSVSTKEWKDFTSRVDVNALYYEISL